MGVYNFKKKKCINLCADAKFERHHAWRRYFMYQPQSPDENPRMCKKKNAKNPMNVEAGIDEKRKSNRIIREKRQKIKAILGTSKTGR